MGFRFVVMFIDSFMDDVTHVRDVEVCMYEIRFVTCRGAFAMALRILVWGSLHDDYVGLAGATPQFYSVAPYRFDCRFVGE